MTRALAAATLWMIGGMAASGALYWAFLNTPESTVFTLALSLVLVLLLYLVAATTWTGLVLGWAGGWSWASLRHSPAGAAPFLLPVAFVAAVWWLVARSLGWMDAHAGEVGAWFIARLDWSDVGWLLDGARRAGHALGWIVAPFVALVWHAQLVTRGARPLVDRATWRRALAPLRLLVVTAVAVLFIRAPTAYGLYWMPAGLPPTWIQPAIAAVKLGLILASAAFGLALIGALAARPDR